MKNFKINYDLIQHKDYSRLIIELQKLGAFRSLLSSWTLLNSYFHSKEALICHLQAFLDSDDKIEIVEFHSYATDVIDNFTLPVSVTRTLFGLGSSAPPIKTSFLEKLFTES